MIFRQKVPVKKYEIGTFRELLGRPIKYFLGKNKVVKKPQTLNCYTHTVFLHVDFWPFLTLGRLSGLFLTFIWQKSLKNNKIKYNYHQKLTCMKYLTRNLKKVTKIQD